MTEQLRAMLGQIADMKAAPDADIAYLTGLETQVLQYLRAPYEQQRLQAQLGGPQNAGPPGGAPMGATPLQQSPAAQLLGLAPAGPPGVPGVMRGHSMPNGDELRRLMEQPAL